MTPEALYRRHAPALSRDEARHNLLLGLLLRERQKPSEGLYLRCFGRPGACALRQPGHGLVLGALDTAECGRLAEETLALDWPGVTGSDDTVPDFLARAAGLGQRFHPPTAMRILLLRAAPCPQTAAGTMRPTTTDEAALLADWLEAFRREALPHDRPPPREGLLAQAGAGTHFLWIHEDRPVALAAVNRQLAGCASLGPIYTPPRHRGRGYAGALTAALAAKILADGRHAVCLYQEVANEAAARCYARVGFRPHCAAWTARRMA